MTFVWSQGRAYTLPSNPNTGDTVVIADRVWTWDGDKWIVTPAPNQTPWLSNIDGGGYQLGNVNAIALGTAAYPPAWGADNSWFFFENQIVGIRFNCTRYDLAGKPLGTIDWFDLANTSGIKRMAGINVVTVGTTPGLRGSSMSFAARPDGGNTDGEVMRMTAVGLGINKGAPVCSLDVAGDVSITGSGDTSGGVLSMRSIVPLSLSPESRINVYADAVATGWSYTTLRFLAGDGIAAPSIQIAIAPSAGATPVNIWQLTSTFMDVAGSLSVHPVLASGSYAFLVRTSGSAITRLAVNNNSGDVGIGNDGVPPFSIPGYTHLIVGPQSTSPQCGIVTACGDTTNPGTSVGSFAFANYSLVSPDKRIADIRGDTGPTIDSGNLTFNTWNAGAPMPRMVITAAGNVGIGTSNPACNLVIDGIEPIVEIRNGGWLQLRPLANAWDMRIQAADQRLDILSGGAPNSPIASFLHGGNVGIGTTAPRSQLAIIPPATPTTPLAAQLTIGEASNSSGYQLGAGYIIDSDLIFKGVIQAVAGGGGTVLTLNPSGGNVGIGTTTPHARLHCEDTTILGGNYLDPNLLLGLMTWTAQIDQGGNQLIFRAKYMDGGVRTGVIPLV